MNRKRDHAGIAERERKALGLPPDTFSNCPKGLDPDYQRKLCKNCGRGIMFVRKSHRNKAHWQHIGDGLRQYRSW